MSEDERSKEEVIIRAVKQALTRVIKDTATPPGMIHPLKDDTIRELRECLLLISKREQELAAAAGRSMDMRPRFVDEPRKQDDVVIPLDASGLTRTKPKDSDS
ncbi:MAG: segregation and condensation protein A [Gammaproteobacteria bacterium]